MRVANPIYDVVFKFLMGDMRIAKLILSKILDQEIETLEFKPTEFRKKIGLNLTVFRNISAGIIRTRTTSTPQTTMQEKKPFPSSAFTSWDILCNILKARWSR